MQYCSRSACVSILLVTGSIYIGKTIEYINSQEKVTRIYCFDCHSNFPHSPGQDIFSTMLKGGESHKKIDLSGNLILRHYYTNKVKYDNDLGSD